MKLVCWFSAAVREGARQRSQGRLGTSWAGASFRLGRVEEDSLPTKDGPGHQRADQTGHSIIPRSSCWSQRKHQEEVAQGSGEFPGRGIGAPRRNASNLRTSSRAAHLCHHSHHPCHCPLPPPFFFLFLLLLPSFPLPLPPRHYYYY